MGIVDIDESVYTFIRDVWIIKIKMIDDN